MANLRLEHINKIYPNNFQAVYDFNLEIKDKEFIVFVGPSGCGKSTTLRMIAGLEEISSGELYIDDVLSNNILSKDRDIAMVFQSYALYPHMTIFNNIAFGLKMRNEKKEIIKQKVEEVAETLGLTEYLNNKPKELSGGQRQRVALGRAIVRNAKIFLMDEPLSNLDAKLRVQMRSEIIKLHERLGTTTIYVTHDQTEAMTMATRIVVMKKGFVQQIGTPKEIYNYPANKFVASFIGSPAMNFFNCKYSKGRVRMGDYLINVRPEMVEKLEKYEGKEIIVGIRPEDIFLSKDDYGIEVSANVVELLGSELIIHSEIAGTSFAWKTTSKNNILPHQNAKIIFESKSLRFFDIETEEGIY